MDGENFTGSASEFLDLTGTPSTSTDDSPVPAPDDTQTAAAEPESAEEELDLSPEERVAAVLAEGIDEDAEDDSVEETEGEDALAAEDAATDLDALTPEQLRALAEEALKLRAESSQTDVERIQREADEAVSTVVAQTQQYIDVEFRRKVLDKSEEHYGSLILEAQKELRDAAYQQTQVDPEAYMERNQGQLANRVRTILRAKQAWENQQRDAWKPQANALLEQEALAARKQHPGIRQLYAEWLAEDRKLPAVAIAEILKEADTDRMHTVADHLAELRKVQLAERRRNNAQRREDAAKTFSANRTTAPATGRPKSAKVVALRGEPEEFLALRKA